MKKILLFITVAAILFIPAFTLVHAQTGLGAAGGNLTKSAQGTGLEKQGDLATTVGTIIKAVLSLVGTIFLVLTIYAGILWMTASGSEEKIKKAKSIISTSIIGLIIVMAAYTITFFVTTKLGGSASSTGGSDVTGCCISPGADNNYSSTQSGCNSANYTWSASPC